VLRVRQGQGHPGHPPEVANGALISARSGRAGAAGRALATRSPDSVSCTCWAAPHFPDSWI